MRSEIDKARLEQFMVALGQRVRGAGRIYLSGGATAVLHGWRAVTKAIDLKPDPGPPGFFEALDRVKEELDINVELASPDQFIPALPGWRERSVFIGRHGPLEFFHYDPYGQALAKLQSRNDRDLREVQSMRQAGLICPKPLQEMFEAIVPELISYPAVDAPWFCAAVSEFCQPPGTLNQPIG